MKNDTELAAVFKALGDPTRLRIFDFIRNCCCGFSVDDSGGVAAASGPTAGEICCRITGADRINSTISHHLKELRRAGLISMDRRGKFMFCTINESAIDRLESFLDVGAKHSERSVGTSATPPQSDSFAQPPPCCISTDEGETQ